jgi:hypothetical protein
MTNIYQTLKSRLRYRVALKVALINTKIPWYSVYWIKLQNSGKVITFGKTKGIQKLFKNS